MSKTRTAPRRGPSKTVYDSWDDVYRSHKPESLPWYAPSVHPVLKAILDRIPVTQGGALDIGCGLGQVARYLAEQGWSVTAVDISSSAIRQAIRSTRPGLKIVYKKQNSLTIDPSLRFDLVVDFLHLHDVQPQDINQYLSLLETLSPRWLVLGYINTRQQEPRVRPSKFFRGQVTEYNHRYVTQALTARGFKTLTIKQFSFRTEATPYECDIVVFRNAQTVRIPKKATT